MDCKAHTIVLVQPFLNVHCTHIPGLYIHIENDDNQVLADDLFMGILLT